MQACYISSDKGQSTDRCQLLQARRGNKEEAEDTERAIRASLASQPGSKAPAVEAFSGSLRPQAAAQQVDAPLQGSRRGV